jgi:preprotein translocase subunit SecG
VGILLAIHVLVTIMLILIVLIQKNEGGSSLFANSGGSGMFNARGTSSILTKATWTLATIFIVNCVIMATMASRGNRVTLITKHEAPQPTAGQPSDAEENGDDDLPSQQAGGPGAPVQPAGAQQQNTPPTEKTQPKKQGRSAASQPSSPSAGKPSSPAAPDNENQ